jgi:hypothetical protein
MDIVKLYMGGYNFDEINDNIKAASIGVNIIVLKEPFNLFKYVGEKPISRKHIGGRSHLINDKFIIKDDGNNKLVFITNLFAKVFGILCPNIVLSELQYYSEGRLLQIIEHIPNWCNYSHNHSRSENFVKQLAKLLSFDLLVCNTNRFIFIHKYVEKYILRRESLKNMIDCKPIDTFIEPINEHNLGFVNNDLWSINHCAHNDIEHIIKYHNHIDPTLIGNCSKMMIQYFNIGERDSYMFEHKLSMYIIKYKKIINVFLQLHSLIN